MARFSLSLRNINKTLLLVTIASLAYKRGHFAGTFIPGPFQVLFVITILLTIIYAVREYTFREFIQLFPKKISIAFCCLFLAVLLGGIIGTVFVGMPVTLAAVRDFGTFTISIIIFFLVLFYTNKDDRFATWCLYVLLIPSIYPFYYFFTHGFVGYWSVMNDNSLSGILDPNVLSKTLLIPALFFISVSLFAMKKKQWWTVVGYTVMASLYVMLIFWTVSRGSVVSLIFGAGLVWVLFSIRAFTWKKLLSSAAIIAIIFSLGFIMLPTGVGQGLHTKIKSTGTLPPSANGKLTHVLSHTAVTTSDLQAAPRTDVRLFEWYYFLRYSFQHPLGVGPSASSINYQKGTDYVQLRPGNTYIQVWLWGGIIALISFLYIIRGAAIALWTKWKSSMSENTLALLGILFALSIAIIFDASLYFYWYFIILALACTV